jgi:hypothetical protein
MLQITHLNDIFVTNYKLRTYLLLKKFKEPTTNVKLKKLIYNLKNLKNYLLRT